MNTRILQLFIFLIITLGACKKKNNEINQSDNTCNLNNVTYQASIQPILQSNCYNCHSKKWSDSVGIIDLETFSSVKDYLVQDYHNDSIYGSKFLHIINHSGSVPDMPPSYKLSECDINKITLWIKNGAIEK